MPNENYVSAISGFDNGGPFGYRSADQADFGALSEEGSFAAFVTCIIRGSYQADGAPLTQYLWGTRDESVPNSGWSITIEDNGLGQAAIVARVGTGGAVIAASYTFTGPTTAPFAERLMQIGLWLSIATSPAVRLTINGSVVGISTELSAPFSPGSLPVSLGIPPVTPTTSAATEVDIVAAGYTYNRSFQNETTDIGDFAGRAFNAERAAMGGAALDPDLGNDWVHRYSTRTLAQSQVASITKQNTTQPTVPPTQFASAQLRQDTFPNPFGYASVPAAAQWADSGNVLVPTNADTAIVPYAPVALQRLGPLFTGGFVSQPFLHGRKNVDWYPGGTYAFPGGA